MVGRLIWIHDRPRADPDSELTATVAVTAFNGGPALHLSRYQLITFINFIVNGRIQIALTFG